MVGCILDSVSQQILRVYDRNIKYQSPPRVIVPYHYALLLSQWVSVCKVVHHIRYGVLYIIVPLMPICNNHKPI